MRTESKSKSTAIFRNWLYTYMVYLYTDIYIVYIDINIYTHKTIENICLDTCTHIHVKKKVISCLSMYPKESNTYEHIL